MRKLIRQLLNKFGYDIVKTENFLAAKSGKTYEVKVGKFNIKMPGNNAQIWNYKNHPTLNNNLGQLAEIIQEKYSGSKIIDVGANVGDTMAIIRSYVDAPIINIEGDEQSFSYLEQNTKLFNNIINLKYFLGERNEVLKVNIDKKGWNNTIIPESDATETLSLITLDNLFEEKGINEDEFKLIKIDVEGFDTVILRGALELVKKNKPAILLEFDARNMLQINEVEKGIATILSLQDFDYEEVLIFDYLNNFIFNTNINNENLFKNLANYSNKPTTNLPYFDICIFSKQDADLAKKFIALVK
jgi:FkbM family methyltransferase